MIKARDAQFSDAFTCSLVDAALHAYLHMYFLSGAGLYVYVFVFVCGVSAGGLHVHMCL